MAEEKGGSGPMGDVIFILGLIAVLIILWFATGGPSRADLKGIFLHPPTPIDQGGAYGPTPTIGSTTIQTGAHY
jgi:hypothetical protein